ncbi:MAG: exodeoxyribonuclease VII large subunit [Lachnospiraceae bacterium]|nr:exodeoxyribonuclease VII large subunit [Lachnospiraceae bacterium]
MSKNIYSVGQINSYIKNMFSQDFMLKNISIKGEVSNCKYHGTGHVYFTLKDEDSAISAVMWKSVVPRGLQFDMRDGDKVVVEGSVEVYERGGVYQIYAKSIQKQGEGDLYQRFLKLKADLEEMGMFDDMFKKPIPKYVKTVGIVTASTGAVIHDIMQVAGRRNPYVQLILCPAQVQGDGAAESICSGIRRLDDMGLDVIIVGRGGGSIEDLWAFNEEIVARTIFECNTPVIAAVGHGSDVTICDFVADKSASTPSAAAEMAVYDYATLISQLRNYQDQLSYGLKNQLQNKRNQIANYSRVLSHLSPESRLNEKRQYLVNLETRLKSDFNRIIDAKKNKLSLYAGRLDGLSPARKMAQGYSFTVSDSGKKITSVDDVLKDDILHIHISDGSIDAKVTDVRKENR